MSTNLTMLMHLDALFDTRMGTLLKLDPDILKHVDIVQYRNRSRDDFEALTGGKVTNEQYEKAYAERDNVTLSKSIISGIIPIVIRYLESVQERYMRKIDITSARVDLNTFPYHIPGPTLQDLRSVLAALLPNYVEINIVRFDIPMLTPDFLDKHYNGWAVYDFNEWLSVHHERLLAKPINGVSTIIPRVHKRDPGDFAVDNEFFMEVDRHGLFEMVMEDFIHLECLPASDFSFILPGTYKVNGD